MKQRNFKEIYDAIYDSVGTEIEAQRKNVLAKALLAILVVFIIFVAMMFSGLNNDTPLLAIVAVFSIVLLIVILAKINRNYKILYKEKVINEIVEKSNPALRYLYKNGISPSEYAASHFDSHWDRYHTEDLIEGKLEDGSHLTMAQVHTEERHTTTDSDGHTQTTYVTTFLGLFGVVKLKTGTNADFMIMNNSKLAKFKKNRIEMESAEFEKYYDVYAGSKDAGLRQNAMEILTPEAIEQFTIIRNLFKRPVNVRVYHDKIYFRIAVGDIFEPPTFKSSLNFEMLRKYFFIIDVPRMIYETLIDNILVMYGDKKAREERIFANMTNEQKEEYLKNQKAEDEATYFSHK